MDAAERSRGVSDEAPDEALVRATMGGDEAAFAHLVRRHLRKAMAVALEYAATREDAEDVVQETFRRVFENLHRFDDARPFEPWFYTVLRNVARNAVRSRLRRSESALSLDHATPAPGPFEETRRRELLGRMREAIERLPAMQRTCFRLCVVEGFSSAEAAVAIGLAESTVRVHVFKARRALQGMLGRLKDEAGEL